MVHRSIISLALATIIVALGVNHSSAAPVGQPAVRGDPTGQILARSGGFGVVRERDNDGIIARDRFAGLPRRNDGASDRFGNIVRRDNDAPGAPDQYGNIVRRDDGARDRFADIIRRDDPAPDRFGNIV